MKPVRTFNSSLIIAIAAAVLIASDSTAQQSYRPSSVPNSETAARASWSPNRSTSPAPVADSQVKHEGLVPVRVRRATAAKKPVAKTAQRGQTSRVVQAGHTHNHQTNSRARKTSQNSVQQAAHTTHRGPVRQAQHVIGGQLPAPARTVGSVINGPIVDGGIYEGAVVDGGTIFQNGPIQTYPLDGQVNLAPVHNGGCDGGASCGCSTGASCGVEAGCGIEAVCDGGCAVGGCDSIGGCTTGGCDSIGGCSGGGCKTSCGGGCSMCGELASPEAWRPCITLRLPQDGWFSAEYLTWWQDGLRLPPLVTTSSPGTDRAAAGVLGQGTTQTLFGGNDILEDSFEGVRLRFGIWLDRCHSWGVGGEYFNIGQETESFSQTSTGDPILTRPFFNTQTGLNDSELVAFPGIVSGNVSVRASSELTGGGFHFRRLRCCQEGCKSWLFCGCKGHFCSRSETLLGYRYLQLDEDVRITENLVSTDPLNPGTFDIVDSFDTRNQFNGIDLGWKYRMTRGYWTFDATMRLAFGNTRQTVRIDGQTVLNDPANPPPATLQGGLLAQTSNIGTFRQNEFSVLPEFRANIGYQLTDHLRATFGYTFLYWSNVVRPGDHIDTDLNPNLLPPAADPFVGVQRPNFAFDTTDYWAQGLSYGLEYRW